MAAVRQKRILVPTAGPDSWKGLLGDPDLHWKEGRSAKMVADLWEGSGALPETLVAMLESGGIIAPELLIAVPEWVTALPDGLRGSQSDVFALLKHDQGTAALVVEAKVNETFGPTVGEWLSSESAARPRRLKDLIEIIGSGSPPPPEVRYQLIHRTAAALIEAGRFGAASAIMVVQSFSNASAGFDEFVDLFRWLGVQDIRPGEIFRVSNDCGAQLYAGWCKEGGGDD